MKAIKDIKFLKEMVFAFAVMLIYLMLVCDANAATVPDKATNVKDEGGNFTSFCFEGKRILKYSSVSGDSMLVIGECK